MSQIVLSNFFCRYLQEYGRCKFERNCLFSHSSTNSFRIPDHVCNFNLKGTCNKLAENCSFLHIDAKELLEQLNALNNIGHSTYTGRSAHDRSSHGRSAHDQPSTSRSLNASNDEQRNSAFKKNFQHSNRRNMHLNDKQAKAKIRQEIICGICLEGINGLDKRFGLLTDCNHCFCYDCLIHWRKQKNLAEDTIKSCPECRLKSEHVIPSRFFAIDDNKKKIIEQYKTNCKKYACKYEKNGRNYCLIRNCLFKHTLPFSEPRPKLSFRVPSVMLNVNNFFIESSDDEDYQLSILTDYLYDHW